MSFCPVNFSNFTFFGSYFNNIASSPYVFNTFPVMDMPALNLGGLNPNCSIFLQNKTVFNMNSFSFDIPALRFNNTFTTFNLDQFTMPSYPSLSSSSHSKTSNKSTGYRTPHWSKLDDAQMRQVYGNYDYDITNLYNGTADDLNEFLDSKSKSCLKGKGDVFMRAQEQYGISALVLVAICGAETAYGTVGNGKNGTNNVANIEKPHNASYSGRWRRFDSVDDCIMELARLLKENYVDNPGPGKAEHLTKLYQVNAKFCPACNESKSDWAKNVQTCMDNIQRSVG